MGEADGGEAVEVGVDQAVGGGLVEELGQSGVLVLDAAADGAGQLGVAASGDDGFEEEAVAGGKFVEQVASEGCQDVGGGLAGVVGPEQPLDLVGDVVVDGVEEECGLAAVAAVDGAGGDAGPSTRSSSRTCAIRDSRSIDSS